MEWLYMAGVGLNASGYYQLIRMLGPGDNTPQLIGLQVASTIGGLILFGFGFFLYDWWIPVIGVVIAPVAMAILTGFTPIGRIPQIGIIVGLSMGLLGLVLH